MDPSEGAPHRTSVRGFGGQVTVSGLGAAGMGDLRAALPATFTVGLAPEAGLGDGPDPVPAYRVASAADGEVELWSGDRRVAVLPSVASAAVQVAARVELDLAAAATTTTVFHAGVVGWKGRALLLPGRSGAGKTTLTAALVCCGATYYTDDFASVDADGWMHPHRRLRPGLPSDAADGPEPPPIRPALVVAARFAPDATWAPEVRRGAGATLDLVDHAFAVTERPGQVLAAARAVARSALALRSRRGEAAALAPRLLELLDAVVADPEQASRRVEARGAGEDDAG